MATETEAYLDEAKTPTTISLEAAQAAVLANLAALDALDLQVSQWSRLLQASEITEEDAELRAMYEEAFQTFGALRRLVGQAGDSARPITAALRQFARVDGRMRERAAAIGYEV